MFEGESNFPGSSPVEKNHGSGGRRISSADIMSTLETQLMRNSKLTAATFRKLMHPAGRFADHRGSRFDICVMEIASDPQTKSPRPSCFGFLSGERRDTADQRFTLGSCGMVSGSWTA
jgi:hypothetical protein